MIFETTTLIHVFIYVCLTISFIFNLLPHGIKEIKFTFSMVMVALLVCIIYWTGVFLFLVSLIKYGSVLNKLDIILIISIIFFKDWVSQYKITSLKKKLRGGEK